MKFISVLRTCLHRGSCSMEKSEEKMAFWAQIAMWAKALNASTRRMGGDFQSTEHCLLHIHGGHVLWVTLSPLRLSLSSTQSGLTLLTWLFREAPCKYSSNPALLGLKHINIRQFCMYLFAISLWKCFQLGQRMKTFFALFSFLIWDVQLTLKSCSFSSVYWE